MYIPTNEEITAEMLKMYLEQFSDHVRELLNENKISAHDAAQYWCLKPQLEANIEKISAKRN
jgi:glycyl-tRNA synthetase beta subunit